MQQQWSLEDFADGMTDVRDFEDSGVTFEVSGDDIARFKAECSAQYWYRVALMSV